MKLEAQCSKDAKKQRYGNAYYWQYLDQSSKESRDYYLKIGDKKKADEMMTRSLSEALKGNDGR